MIAIWQKFSSETVWMLICGVATLDEALDFVAKNAELETKYELWCGRVQYLPERYAKTEDGWVERP